MVGIEADDAYFGRTIYSVNSKIADSLPRIFYSAWAISELNYISLF